MSCKLCVIKVIQNPLEKCPGSWNLLLNRSLPFACRSLSGAFQSPSSCFESPLISSRPPSSFSGLPHLPLSPFRPLSLSLFVLLFSSRSNVNHCWLQRHRFHPKNKSYGINGHYYCFRAYRKCRAQMVCVRKSVFLAEPHDGVEKLSSLACFLFLFLSVDFFCSRCSPKENGKSWCQLNTISCRNNILGGHSHHNFVLLCKTQTQSRQHQFN